MANWTPDMDEVLTARWIAGESTRVIAAAIGVSRNAVIGRAHRIGCPVHNMQRASITLVLPLPPSTNNLFVNGKRGRYKSQKYRDWLEQAGAYLMQQRFKKDTIKGPYTMKIRVPMKCRADITNLLKAPEDALVFIGVLPDDKHCHDARIYRDAAVPEFDCYVTVRAV